VTVLWLYIVYSTARTHAAPCCNGRSWNKKPPARHIWTTSSSRLCPCTHGSLPAHGPQPHTRSSTTLQCILYPSRHLLIHKKKGDSILYLTSRSTSSIPCCVYIYIQRCPYIQGPSQLHAAQKTLQSRARVFLGDQNLLRYSTRHLYIIHVGDDRDAGCAEFLDPLFLCPPEYGRVAFGKRDIRKRAGFFSPYFSCSWRVRWERAFFCMARRALYRRAKLLTWRGIAYWLVGVLGRVR
jgi:hypothetical protein